MPSLIGTKSNQVPTVGDLGTLAFQDASNVLVGNINATGVTTVQAGTASAPAITTTGDTNTGVFFPAADTIAFAEGGAESMRLDSNGNLGLGTTSPNERLQIAGIDGANIRIYGRNGILSNGITSNYFYNGSSWVRDASGGASGMVLGTPSDPFIAFSNTTATSGLPTERMRITSGGNLLVGTATNTDNVRYLFSNSSGRASQILQNASDAWGLSVDVPSNYVDTAYLARCGRTSGFDQFNYFVGQSNLTTRVQIRGDGNLLNLNNSYGGISDIKLKENIVDATPKLEKLNQVRVVNYNLIGEEQKQIGVIAQELEQIFPSMVEETIDRDAEGNDLGTTTKAVKYSVFVPMLIKAIQEQQAIITDLKSRIEILESTQG
jgi:hypothetical protein